MESAILMKEYDSCFLEMRHLVTNILPLFPIMSIIYTSCTLGALTALLIQHRPRIERFCRVYAMASMLSALAILLYATAFCGFRYPPHLAEQKIKTWMKKFTTYW
ncbi:hypothetical protein CMV_014692 [Castanea mollissima]|uniref:Uncharacterized protein n=1 Tax=Castanea mollissima TaxID=60419 RepID=A0A8J4VKS9_9ROSI|nr:hypothetical protein CMV_014692 [Castanea mollissima]